MKNMYIYTKIYEDILQKISSGKLKQGEKLPSLSSMAHKYGCSKATIIKSYEKLAQSHIIFSKPNSGFYVADDLVRNPINQNIKYNLSTGNPCVDTFSLTDIKHCLNLAVDLYAKNTIDLPLRGVSSLNDFLVHYLECEGIYTQQSNINLIQGITSVLSMLSLSPFPNKKEIILIEEPSFWNYVRFLKKSNISVMTIRRDEKGLDLELIEYYFKNFKIKFFYTIPRNHNPLGTILSYKQRKKIMELALKYDVYVIEDDYFAGDYPVSKYVPISYFSYQKNCVYLRSCSKKIPFIRIGIAIIPNDLQSTFQNIANTFYYYSYYMPSLISQAAYESYLKSKLVVKQEEIINRRIKEMLYIVRTESELWDSKIITVIGAKCGYYFTCKLHKKIDIQQYIVDLEKNNVHVMNNIKSYYNECNFDNSIRVSIAQMTSFRLKEALNILYQCALNLFYS